MELFRISGPCPRQEYAELWIAVMMILGILVLAVNGGWLNFPKDRCDLLSAEYLPLVVQVAGPLCAAVWAFCASTVRRCRDARFPVHVLLLFSAFFVLSTVTARVAASGSVVSGVLLDVLVWMSAFLLALVLTGLLLLDQIVLDDGSTAGVKQFVPHIRKLALFGHANPGRLVVEWRRRARAPAVENPTDYKSLDLSNPSAGRME